MKISAPLAAAALLALTSVPALAHHSAIMFDFTRSAQVKGVVKKFELINPHMVLVLHVKDAKGERDIAFEGHSRNNMYRAGWRADMVKAGDTITVNIAPMRNGSDGGFVTSAVATDGRTFGMPSARLQQQPPRQNP